MIGHELEKIVNYGTKKRENRNLNLFLFSVFFFDLPFLVDAIAIAKKLCNSTDFLHLFIFLELRKYTTPWS